MGRGIGVQELVQWFIVNRECGGRGNIWMNIEFEDLRQVSSTKINSQNGETVRETSVGDFLSSNNKLVMSS